jgi:predicted aminopeptidase
MPRTIGGGLCFVWRRSGETDGETTHLDATARPYRELKQGWGGYAGYDRWFDQDLNNAKLAGNSTYHRWVPAFLALYEREGRDFAAFYRAAEAIGQLPPAGAGSAVAGSLAPFRRAGKRSRERR